ncbi:MAG: MerR family transcriptional regulator [Acutalibacter sp.]|jgi:DNA-binding transcriptional MerR regulator
MQSTQEGLLASEFADLCGVSKDTLLYYDKIGLFSPEQVADNGYRVYSLDQVHTFDLLLILRDSHLPLKEIKGYLESRNAREMLDLLKKQARSLQEEIAQLESLYNRLELTASQMERGMEPVQKQPSIQQREEKLYVVVPIPPGILPDRKQRMKAVREFLRACRQKGLQGDYLRCAVISKERLLRGCYDKEYFCISLEGLPQTDQIGELVLKQPKGTYAVLRHYGSYRDLAASYRKLAEYIAQQHLTIRGNAYETELMGYISEQSDSDYVIEIAVEVDR